FEFSCEMPNAMDESSPWAGRLSAPAVELTRPCTACGARRMAFRGTCIASRVSGSYWADIIGSGSGATGPPFMFSERVVQALTALGGKGFVAYPVVIESSHDPRLAKLQAPNYFYLSVCGEIKIDWQRSGLNEPCPVCGAPLRPQIRAPRRLIPVDGSWDG